MHVQVSAYYRVHRSAIRGRGGKGGGYAVRERMHDHEATGGTARIRPGSGIMSNRGGLGLAGASRTRDYPQQRARRNGRGRGRDCVLKRSVLA